MKTLDRDSKRQLLAKAPNELKSIKKSPENDQSTKTPEKNRTVGGVEEKFIVLKFQSDWTYCCSASWRIEVGGL